MSAPQEASTRRLAAGIHFLRHSLAQGIRDGLSLLRRRSIGVIAGSLGTMVFDLAVSWVCASGRSAPHPRSACSCSAT